MTPRKRTGKRKKRSELVADWVFNNWESMRETLLVNESDAATFRMMVRAAYCAGWNAAVVYVRKRQKNRKKR